MAKKTKTTKNNTAKPKQKNTFLKKVLYAFVGIAIVGIAAMIYLAYANIYKSNIVLKDGNETFFYTKTGSNFNDVMQSLKREKIVKNELVFEWLAKQKNYVNKIKPGKYKITNGMSNNELVNLLRSGAQTPVKLTFSNIRNKKELVRKVCTQLETDSTELAEILSNDNVLDSIGFDSENILAMFIPNTYEMKWNTTAKSFFTDMKLEYKKFWNESRIALKNKLKLKQAQVSIIASIVEKETQYKPERPTVASVYINRLRKGMKLQADPTVIYAIGDFTIHRLLDKHLSFDNPYNTYKYEGLPPGPICLPSINAIDAVLNAANTNYIYFCAKEDFSGKHNFAATLAQHNANAQRFQREMNRRKIYK